ncbi:MAG: SGNH/GDSL hydrolase family protein [Thermoanaerobaculia bacterium]
MNRFTKFATAVVVAALILALPAFAQRGSADFSRFVALGDSYGAGVVSSSLNERHQVWSWPAVIARQVGYTTCQPNADAASPCFAQPLVTYPGIGPELVLVNLAPTIAPAGGFGSPVMTTFGRPYNNLSIPGATVGALLQLTGAEPQTPNEPTAVSMARFILRGQGTAVQQALAQQPTFIAVWIGGNDALSTLFSGTPNTLTSAADFRTRYAALLSALVAGAPNAGIIVGNLPPKPLPYMLLIPPVVVNPATGQPVPGPDGNPIPLIADLGDGNIGPLPAGSFVLLHARTNLATGYGLPNFPPFNAFPNAGKPLPDSDVITPTEFATILTRVNEYNAAIQAEASARSIPVANIAGLFDRVYAPGGMQIGPVTISAQPVTGGFFGFDFFHLTDLGYLMFANEYIKTINAEYDTEIPLAGIAQLYANNGAFFPETADGQLVTNADRLQVTDAAAAQIRTMWAQPTMKRRPISISIR